MLRALMEKRLAGAHEKFHIQIHFIFPSGKRKRKQNDVFEKSLSTLISGTPVNCLQFHVLRMWCAQ